jgi:hypothetical protein
MLLNVAAHNVSIRNVKVSKRKRHITYSVTKRMVSQNVQCTKCKRQKTSTSENVKQRLHCRDLTRVISILKESTLEDKQSDYLRQGSNPANLRLRRALYLNSYLESLIVDIRNI